MYLIGATRLYYWGRASFGGTRGRVQWASYREVWTRFS